MSFSVARAARVVVALARIDREASVAPAANPSPASTSTTRAGVGASRAPRSADAQIVDKQQPARRRVGSPRRGTCGVARFQDGHVEPVGESGSALRAALLAPAIALAGVRPSSAGARTDRSGSGTRRRRSPAEKPVQSIATPASHRRPERLATCAAPASSSCARRQARQHRPHALARAAGAAGPARQRRRRAHFEQHRARDRPAARRPRGKPHRLPQVPRPVPRDRSPPPRDPRARHVRQERNPRRLRAAPPPPRRERRRATGVHHRRVERVRRLAAAAPSMPRAVSRSASASIAAVRARHHRNRRPVHRRERQRRRRAAASARFAAAAPPASRPAAPARISRPRGATSASASSSENTPARQAATYSPTLWPSSADGRDAPRIHSCASAYSSTNSAGCDSGRLGRSRGPGRPPGAQHHLAQSQPRCACSTPRSGRPPRGTPARRVELARHAGVLRALTAEQERDAAVRRAAA